VRGSVYAADLLLWCGPQPACTPNSHGALFLVRRLSGTRACLGRAASSPELKLGDVSAAAAAAVVVVGRAGLVDAAAGGFFAACGRKFVLHTQGARAGGGLMGSCAAGFDRYWPALADFLLAILALHRPISGIRNRHWQSPGRYHNSPGEGADEGAQAVLAAVQCLSGGCCWLICALCLLSSLAVQVLLLLP
jgi:hypothetical protein